MLTRRVWKHFLLLLLNSISFFFDLLEGENWSLWRVAVEAFAGCMIVSILCDVWRLVMADYMVTLIGAAASGANSTIVPFLHHAY